MSRAIELDMGAKFTVLLYTTARSIMNASWYAQLHCACILAAKLPVFKSIRSQGVDAVMSLCVYSCVYTN